VNASLGRLAILAAGAAVLAAPFFSRSEMFAAFDSPTHLHWAASFRRSLGEGNLYPRWQPEAFAGFGAPTFVFYPALPYYVASAFSALGAATSVKCSLALSFFLSGGAQYLFLRELLTPGLALLGAVAYLALPAHLVQASPFFLFSSLWSLTFLPLAFRGARRTARGDGAAGLAFATGGLLASHLPTSVTALPFVVLFGLVSAEKGRRLPALGSLGAGLAWGAAIGAIYWLPALGESSFIQARYHVEWNRLEDNFLYASDHPLGEGYLAVNHLISLAASLAAGLSLFAYLACRADSPGRSRSEIRFFGAAAGLAFFLMTPLARPVWSLAPALRWLEFPWRLLNVEIMATSALLALGLGSVIPRRALWGGVTVAVAGLNLALSGWLLSQVVFFSPDVERRAVETGIFEVVAFLPREARAPAGKYQKASLPLVPEVETVGGEARLRLLLWAAEERAVGLPAGGPVTLRLRTFAFPGWQAEIDGKPTPLGTEPGSGALRVEAPAGARELRLSFRPTPLRRLAAGFSIGGVLLFAGVGGRDWARRRRR